ncbi:hypothetical protein GCM10027419_40980 [Pandoraea terrae]
MGPGANAAHGSGTEGNHADGGFGRVWRRTPSRVASASDALRWVRHWHGMRAGALARDDVLQVRVHGGVLNGLTIEARAGGGGVALQLDTPSVRMRVRLRTHAAAMAASLARQLGCPVSIAVPAEHVGTGTDGMHRVTCPSGPHWHRDT